MATPASSLWQWFTPRRWSRALALLVEREDQHPFDRAHRVDTGGLLYADALARGDRFDPQNAGYYATAPSLFRGAIDLWRQTLPVTRYTESDYTLIDIGCGKGRVLMLATECEFRQIIGIEIAPRLSRTARKNLRKWTRVGRPESRVHIIEGDALAVPLPEGPAALFYFNSFERELTGRWLSRLAEIARTRTAPLDLIYVHPEFDALVRQLPGIQPLAEADIPFSPEDAAADAFHVSVDRCSIYRLSR